MAGKWKIFEGYEGRIRRIGCAALLAGLALELLGNAGLTGRIAGMGEEVQAAAPMEETAPQLLPGSWAGFEDCLVGQGWAGWQDFTGRDEESVKRELEPYGCKVTGSYRYDDTVPEGHVIAQISEDAMKIDHITLVVSLGKGGKTDPEDGYQILAASEKRAEQKAEEMKDIAASEPDKEGVVLRMENLEFYRFVGADGLEFVYPVGVFDRSLEEKDGEDWTISFYGRGGRLQYRTDSLEQADAALPAEEQMAQHMDGWKKAFGEISYSYEGWKDSQPGCWPAGCQIGIVTGQRRGMEGYATYLLCSIQEGRLYEMEVTYPVSGDEEDDFWAYLTDCLYRSCPFSGAEGGRLSFEEYFG